jgi:hypothetical protein
MQAQERFLPDSPLVVLNIKGNSWMHGAFSQPLQLGTSFFNK